jgi:para-nitrobenzyl esterase
MAFRNLFAAACVLAVAGFAGCGGSSDDPTLVDTPLGQLRGAASGNVLKFQGIRYAAAPTGELRFRGPQALAAWSGTRDALVPGSSCPQATQTKTEDCLFLNVTVPSPQTRANMPVLVFVHGGGFALGEGATTDASALAATGNFIVVTVNYRLGILGYLANSALDSGSGGIGNFGLQDQQAALRWVQQNIQSFGGDPANVTLGGSSAGAMSTCNHMVSPASQGLFKQVIVMSGPCALNWEAVPQKLASEADLPAKLGCTGTPAELAACLRSPNLSLASLMAVQATVPRAVLFPSVGGAEVPVQPRTALGKFPMLIGWTSLENGFRQATPADAAAYLAALTTVFGADNANAIAGTYPFGSFKNGNVALNTVMSDFSLQLGSPQVSVCNDVRTLELRSTAGSAPLYAYEFADPAAPPAIGSTGGPTHTSELPYVFSTAATPLPAGSQSLSTTMVSYWANFINTSNPNGSGLPTWPMYTTADTVLKMLPQSIAPYDADVAHRCGFWKSLGYAL